MPSSLQWLLTRLIKLIATATTSLEQSYPDGVQAWQQEVSRQLARYHAAALMAGAGAPALTAAARVKVTSDLAAQLKWLGKFGLEIQGGAQWQAGWNARAASYANSIKVPYWRGAVKMLPLPAMPAEGTNCYGNCGCAWEIEELDGEGNADAYWRRSKDDSCGTCIQRERDWSPVRIRGGVLQVDTDVRMKQTDQEKAMFANMGNSGGGGSGGGSKLWPKGPSGKRTPQAAGAESRGDTKPEETTDATDKALRQAGLITDKKMTPQEAQSLQWYQGVGHDRINAELRGSAPVRDQYTLDMTTGNIDQAMDRSKLKRDVDVHRGMYMDTPHAEAQLAQMQPGKTFRDPGYVSTSASRDVARKFGTDRVSVRIRARAGTPAIYMPTASPLRMTSKGSHNEYELLLGRNLKYRVVSRQDSGGRTTIELEVVP